MNISITEKEIGYLKDREMYQLLLESGGYITVESYAKRGNLDEHVEQMKRCLKEGRNTFLRERDQSY